MMMIIIIIIMQVVQEYERAVIFRLGRLLSGGSRGPGGYYHGLDDDDADADDDGDDGDGDDDGDDNDGRNGSESYLNISLMSCTDTIISNDGVSAFVMKTGNIKRLLENSS